MVLLQLRNFNGFSQRPLVHPLVRQKRRKRAQTNMCLQAQSVAPSRTQRIMESISVSGEVGGAGGAYSYGALKRLDGIWSSICSAQTVLQEPQQVVSSIPGLFSQSDLANKPVDTFDVVVCGGTLGIFLATVLSFKGLRVAIVERNILKGREQEWNISRKELFELVECGILTEEEVEQATAVKFNPNRCGFKGKGDIWVEDILNLGVSPVKLIEFVKKRFISLGGIIFEGYSVSSISIYEDAAVLKLVGGNILSSRLIIDAMGNFSPVVKQIRRGRKPDGVCLVVGSCGRGFINNLTSDVIYSSSSVKKVGHSDVQLFWEFGDASGIQSPVSFGGFGSLTRHLGRLSTGIYEAISEDFVDSYSLSLLNPYMPNLSASWLFQRAMSAKWQSNVSPDFINELLYVNFKSMQRLGDPVLRPFLQDVIKFGPLAKTLGLVMLSKPQIIPSIFKQVGIPVLVDWSSHFFMLGYHTILSTFADPVIRSLLSAFPSRMKYEWKRHLEAWKYGAGLDYKL